MTGEIVENWKKYGFPDPTLYPPYLPVVGIIKALNERMEMDQTLVPVELPEFFSDALNIRNFPWLLRELDSYIKYIATHKFIVPEKFDYYIADPQTRSMYWSWDELLLAGANGHEEAVIHADWPTDFLRFTPSFPAEWARQRYRMINLLKYAEVSISADYIYGYTQTVAATKQLAYEAAIANISSVSQPNPNSSVEANTFQFDGTNYYGVSFHLCRQIAPVLPSGVPLTADAYLVCETHPAYGTFDDLGSNLQQGWNRIKMDSNGLFINTPQIPYPQAWDSVDNYYAGWDFGYNNYFAYADVTEHFKFKEEPSS